MIVKPTKSAAALQALNSIYLYIVKSYRKSTRGCFFFIDQLQLIQTSSVLKCLMIVCSVRGLHAQLRERTVLCFPLRVPLKYTNNLPNFHTLKN